MTINSNITELGTKPIGSLLLKYAAPAIIAMTASSLYNIVDAIFIGKGVGALAIAGVALSFPVMQLTAAFGAMIGVGAATLLSVKLGQKDYDVARKILGNVFVLNILMGIVIGIAMLLFLDNILYFFGASGDTIGYTRDFMVIILLGNVVTHLYLGMNNLLRAAGHPRKAMYATIATVIVNIILAPLFIYSFHWGIQGAAGATVLSQVVVLLWQLKIFSDKNEFIHFERQNFRLSNRIVRSTIAIGISPFLMNLCACLVTVFFNWSLAHYGGDLEIAAFGISNRLAFLFIMIVIGLNQGMQPIAGYNYGAHNFERLRQVLIKAITAATCIVCAGFLLSLLVPYQCASAFTTDPQLIESSVKAIRIMFLAFPIIGFQIVTTNFFQCIGQVKKSIFLSLTRQLLFIIPLLAILPRYYGTDGIWYTQPVSDALATFVASFFLFRALKTFKSNQKTNS